MFFLRLMTLMVFGRPGVIFGKKQFETGNSRFKLLLKGRLISFELHCSSESFDFTEKNLIEALTSKEDETFQEELEDYDNSKTCEKYFILPDIHEKYFDGWIGISFDSSSKSRKTRCFDKDASFFVLELNHEKINTLVSALGSILHSESRKELTLGFLLFTEESIVSFQNYKKHQRHSIDLVCKEGKFLNTNHECTSCALGCLQCENFEFCLKCREGYYFDEGLCLTCHKSCFTCADSSPCIGFIEGYQERIRRSLLERSCHDGCFKDFNLPCLFSQDFCDVCDSMTREPRMYYPDLSLYVCDSSKRCYSNCLKCDLVCILCKKGFSLVDGKCKCSNECQICYPGCVKCEENQCIKCSLGFYLVSWGCLTCGANGCLKSKECMTGYYIDWGKCLECKYPCLQCLDYLDCTECDVGYFLMNGECQGCEQNCLKCLNYTYCLECDLYSVLKLSRCIKKPYIPYCSSYLNETHCANCINSYYLDSGQCLNCGLKCQSCSKRYDCNECSIKNITPYDGNCYDCDNKCEKCLYNQICTKCEENYFLSDDICVMSDILKCKTFLDMNSCAECFPDYFLYFGRCYPCIYPCVKCLSVYTCLECSDNDYLDQGVCIYFMDENCLRYYNKSYCIECIDGYFVKSGKCISCEYPCLRCLDEINCLECDSDYLSPIINRCSYCDYYCSICTNLTHCSECSESSMYLDSGRCLPCSDGCSACNSRDNCTECLSGYYIKSGKCYECAKNCKICLDENRCLVCKTIYKLTYGKCYQISFCLKFTKDSECEVCYLKFYLDSGSCYACGVNCFKCINKKSCLECDEGYYLYLEHCYFCGYGCKVCSDKHSCTTCSDKYYLYNEKCFSCSLNCLRCSKDGKCTMCNSKSYLIEGYCYSCSFPCLECGISNNCLKCSSAYYLESDKCLRCGKLCQNCDSKSNCYNCILGSYLESGMCFPCANNCYMCISHDICLFCMASYYLEDGKCYSCPENCSFCLTKFHCFDCVKSYFLYHVECLSCPQNCLNCFNSTFCLLCESSHYYLKSGTCYSCDINCYMCKDKNECTHCISGYYLNDGICNKCGPNCWRCENPKICLECHNDNYYLDMSGECLKCKPGMRWVQYNDINSLTVNNEIMKICFNKFLNFTNEEDLRTISPMLELLKNQIESKENCFYFDLKPSFPFDDEIYLFLEEIQIDKKVCNIYNSNNPQSIKINYISEKPNPIVFMQLNIVSLPNLNNSCDVTKQFNFDASSSFSKYQTNLNFSWSISINSHEPIIYGNYKNLKIKLTNVEKISANLTVKTSFNTSDSIIKSWEFELNKDIAIEIGDVIICKKSMDCEILIDRLIFCTDVKYIKYKWRINKVNLDQDRHSLIVYKNSLDSGTYNCTLSIEYDSFKTSTKNFTLIILPEPLKIYFNRSPGNISSQDDLILDVSESINPNAKLLALRYLQESQFRSLSTKDSDLVLFNWECLFLSSKKSSKKYSKCPNNEESVESKLIISKENLINFNQISIKLGVNSNNQSESYYFNASISSEIIPLVNIFEFYTKGKPNKFPILKTTVLAADVISINDNDIAKWSIEKFIEYSGYLIEIKPDEIGLNEGTFYHLKFNLANESRTLEFYYDFEVNQRPRHGSFVVDPSSGEEFKDIFTFIAKEWEDVDLPLRYYFAYGDNSSEILLRMSLLDTYSTTLKMLFGNTFANCRVYDALEDFTSKKFSIQITETNQIENIIKDIFTDIEPPSSIPVKVTHILIATLFRGNNYSQNDSTINQQIYEISINHINIFINTSQPSDFFIDQSLELLNFSTFNSEITRNNSYNINLGLDLTENLLKKIAKIGINEIQASKFFDVIQNIQELNDEIIIKDTEKLKRFINLTTLINLEIMKRMNYESSIKIDSKNIQSFISVIKNKNRKEIISGLNYSAHIPADLELECEPEDLLGIVHTQFKETSKNSMHYLVSLSIFNKSDDSFEISVKSSKSRIVAQIPISQDADDVKNGACYYFDEVEGEWRTDGCNKIVSDPIIAASEDAVLCSCNHLTTFGYGIFKRSSHKSHGVEEFTINTFSLPGFILPIILLFIMFLTLLRAKFFQKTKNKIQSSNTLENQKESSFEIDDVKKYEKNNQKVFRNNYERKTGKHNPVNFSFGISSQEQNHEKTLEQSSDRNLTIDLDSPIEDQSNTEIYFNEEKSKISENPETGFDDDIEEVKEKSISENYPSQLDKPAFLSEPKELSSMNLIQKISKLFILYSHHCKIISVVILNRSVNIKYYKITKIFLIFFLKLLFDALFFDFNYRKQKVKNFESILENSLQSFIAITVLFTSAIITGVKIILYIIEVLLVKRTIKYLYMVLPVINILINVYLVYKVSCLSTAFGKKISRYLLICFLISIFTEILIFEPVSSILLKTITKVLKKSEVLQMLYRKTLFWRFFRCKTCKNCMNGLSCDSCIICLNCN